MRILVTNIRLDQPGGSETFTYAMAGELRRRGDEVDVFTTKSGVVAERIARDLGVTVYESARDLPDYELVLASHKPCVDKIRGCGFVVQTCHGITPNAERPSRVADAFVAVSEEVRRRLDLAGFQSPVIWNGVDCRRFRPLSELGENVRRVLSLCHNEDLNARLGKWFGARGIRFSALNKLKNPVWDVERHINGCDLVISIGRGVYEALACGRPVVVLDHRHYGTLAGDGLVTQENLLALMKTNCSGRCYGRRDVENMLREALDVYDAGASTVYRRLACEHFDIRRQVGKYLALWRRLMGIPNYTP